MAYISKFIISNFKGIENLSIDIKNKVNCPVITLVGLNESGKTTILEAIAHFVTKESTIAAEKKNVDKTPVLDFVPISKKANFTGSVKVSAEVIVEDKDFKNISERIYRLGYDLEKSSFPSRIIVTNEYKYKDGIFEKSVNTWTLSFKAKTRRAKIFKDYSGPNKYSNSKIDVWIKCVQALKKTLPKIAYFPTFLVNIPEQIYLVEREGEHPAQRYFRGVIQDVLNSLDEDLDLQKHVVDRIKDYQKAEDSPNWFNKFYSRPEKRMVDSVMQKLSTAISKEVIGSWKNIFNRPISAKMITLDWSVDLENDSIPYLNISISDGESKYALHERSLGFRWFFLFLLFTRFKKSTESPTLFLFDEPAANLHARAQSELLLSFYKIIDNNNGVIYSTHSTHMINPEWISAAYIVENKAINYEENDDVLSFASPPTSISAIPYRQFVSNYPKRTSYYQPILERLDYVAPSIKPEGPFIITEGISDFHVFSYYCGDLLAERGIQLIPGLGDTSHDVQISMLLGMGSKFIVVLDDDKSGRKGADRYREKWLLDKSSIATVGDFSNEAKGKNLEKLLSKETIGQVANHFSKSKPTKKEIALFFAEANAGLIQFKSNKTQKLIKNIILKAIGCLENGVD